MYGVIDPCTSNSGNQFDVPEAAQKWVCIDLEVTSITKEAGPGGFMFPNIGIVGEDGFTYDQVAFTLDSRAWEGDPVPIGQTQRKLLFIDVPLSAGGVREVQIGDAIITT